MLEARKVSITNVIVKELSDEANKKSTRQSKKIASLSSAKPTSMLEACRPLLSPSCHMSAFIFFSPCVLHHTSLSSRGNSSEFLLRS